MGWILKLLSLIGKLIGQFREGYDREVKVYQADAKQQDAVDQEATEKAAEIDRQTADVQRETDVRVEEVTRETQARKQAIDARPDRDVLRDLDL